MIKMLSIIIAFLSLNICNVTSIEEETFMDNVNKAYDEYKVVIDEETHSGDVTIVFGIKKDDYYLSAFFLNESAGNFNLQIYIDDVLENTFVQEGTVINAFGVEVEEAEMVNVLIHHDSQDFKYQLDIEKLIEEDGFVEGLGEIKFPQNKFETDIIKIIRLLIFGFAAISCCFIFVIVYFYKKRKGRFNNGYKERIDVVNDYYEEYGDPEEDAKKDIEQVNKQALMDRYFEEYRKGDITEEELNEKLKRLWWQDDKN